MVTHLEHIRISMLIKHVISTTECRQTSISVFGAVETMFRTLAVTDIGKLAGETSVRKCITFFKTELILLLRCGHLPERALRYIADKIFGVDKMVTRIDITIMFYHRIAPQVAAYAHDPG